MLHRHSHDLNDHSASPIPDLHPNKLPVMDLPFRTSLPSPSTDVTTGPSLNDDVTVGSQAPFAVFTVVDFE